MKVNVTQYQYKTQEVASSMLKQTAGLKQQVKKVSKK